MSARSKGRTAGVIAAIEDESARLLGIVRGQDVTRVAEPVVGEWSPRDVLAHCVYWQGMLARMMGAPLPPPSWIPRWQSEDQLGADEINRLTVEHYRGIALDTLLSDFAFTADVVTRIVGEMKEENLELEAGAPWEPGKRVWQAIAGETHAHWREHAYELETAMRERGSKGAPGAGPSRPREKSPPAKR